MGGTVDLLNFLNTPSYRNRVLAIGIGTAGCRIASQLQHMSNLIGKFVYVSCDEEDFPQSTIGERVLIPLEVLGKVSPKVIRGATLKYLPYFDELLKDSFLIFLISGLGGSVGTGLAPFLAERIHKSGAFGVGIFVMPFRFEKNKHFYAGTALRKLKSSMDAMIIIDNDGILESMGELPIRDSYRSINRLIASALNSMIEASAESELNVGIRKFIDTVRCNGYSILCLSRSSSTNRCEEAVIGAIRSLYRVADPEKATKAILFLMGGGVSANEISMAVSRLNSLVGDGAVEIHYGVGNSLGTNSLLTVALLTSGFSKTKFDEYDPLSKIPYNIDDQLDIS
ncbi:MAG: hypothetical protein N3F06_00650, partial [Nitrososphaerales archaeon]|nr:hypothetical protein [Nitrososphaerales archaeon]